MGRGVMGRGCNGKGRYGKERRGVLGVNPRRLFSTFFSELHNRERRLYEDGAYLKLKDLIQIYTVLASILKSKYSHFELDNITFDKQKWPIYI